MRNHLQKVIATLGLISAIISLQLLLGGYRLQPPWPDNIQYFTVALFLVVSALVFQSRNRIKRRRRLLIASGLWSGLFFALYALAASYAVVEAPTLGRRFIVGFVCTPEAAAIYGDRCPFLSLNDIAAAAYEPTRIWTRSSLLAANLMLLASWLGFQLGAILFVNIAALDEPPDVAANTPPSAAMKRPRTRRQPPPR